MTILNNIANKREAKKELSNIGINGKKLYSVDTQDHVLYYFHDEPCAVLDKNKKELEVFEKC